MCWRISSLVALLISAIGCGLLPPDESVTPTPIVVVVTVAPTPTPVIIVVTATPEPSPTVAAVTTAPVPTVPPSATPVPTVQIPRVSVTPAPTATAPLSTATPKPPESTRTPTPTSTPTPLPTRTAEVSSPTPIAAVDPNRPDRRHTELKQYVLELVNDQRKSLGRGPVVLGRNVAAQLHAESMLDNCFASHWGLDGLKPHMRYFLAGSYQAGGESISGVSYCHSDTGSLPPYNDLRAKVQHSLGSWIGGPANVLLLTEESYKVVNIGLAWNKYQVFTVLYFEKGYVESLREATVDDDHLILAASVHDGVVFEHDLNLLIEIAYDPPVRPLNRGQLSRTYCYDSGTRVAALRPFSIEGLNRYVTEYGSCSDPYNVPVGAPYPRTVRDAHDYREEATKSELVSYSVPYIEAAEWLVTEDSFSVRADISEVLGAYGPGVYTVLVYGPVDGKTTLIMEYPIFYRTDRPATYDRW